MVAIAVVSKALSLRTLRSAWAFVLKLGKSNSFNMCSGCSKLHAVFFFQSSVEFYSKAASPTPQSKISIYNFFSIMAILFFLGGGGCTFLIGLILRYIVVLNRYYNFTKNQLGPPKVDGDI